MDEVEVPDVEVCMIIGPSLWGVCIFFYGDVLFEQVKYAREGVPRQNPGHYRCHDADDD